MAMLQEDNAAVWDVIRESKHNNQPMQLHGQAQFY
jgi:hypothetical protein